MTEPNGNTNSRSANKSVFTWRGVIDDAPQQARVTTMVALAVCIVALSLTQVGVFHLGSSTDMSMAFARFTLAPVAMAAFLFGVAGGAITGLAAGLVAFGHAMLLPADYYEQYYVGPLNAIISFALAGFLFGILFALIDRHVEKRGARIAAVAGAALAGSVVFNAVFYALLVVQLSSIDSLLDPGMFVDLASNGTLFAIPLEAAAVFIACLAIDLVTQSMRSGSDQLKLSRVFQSWLLLVVVIVFMVIESTQFVGVSISEYDSAERSILSELDYIDRQLNEHGSSPEDVLDGYDTDLDGYVIVIQGDRVVATNDPTTEIGWTTDELFDYDPETESGQGQEALAQLVEEGSAHVNMISDDGHVETCYLFARQFGDYTAMISRPTGKIYAERAITLAWTTIAIGITLAAVFLLATLLLDRVVVRRIDETNETLDRITNGDLNARVNIRDSLEFSSLSAGVNTTVASLKDAIAEAEQRNAQELMTAKAIQESSLPSEFPAFPDIDTFDIYASMKTAKEVGGDFYDFFLTDDDRLGFVIADVSGKGIPAALFMMTAKTQVKSYMESGLAIGEAINATNHQLCLNNDAGMFVTMFACVLDHRTGELSYVNAGHNPPLIQHGGTWEWMREVSGMPLGLFDGIPYKQLDRKLEKDDVLYLYTDGVTEAMDQDGALFTEERLERTLYEYAKMNPRSICVGMRRAITDFTKDCEQSDDITMLALKYGVPPETKAVMILRAETSQLVHVLNYIHAELHRRNAPKSVRNPLDIAAEELFVNVCRYAYPDATPENPGEVRISFEYDANPPSLTVQIADDGIAYNPLAKPDATTVDEFESIADVPIGGLGILMAKKSVDSMGYERENGSNILTFKKSW